VPGRRQRARTAEKESLPVADTQLDQRLELRIYLDAFGHHRGVGLAGELKQRRRRYSARGVAVDSGDQAQIQLAQLRTQLEYVPKARVAGTGVK